MIDGEGQISLHKLKRKNIKRGFEWRPYVEVAATCSDILDPLQDFLGDGHPYTRKGKGNRKTLYAYRMNRSDMRRILPGLSLVIKERQRVLLIEALSILFGSGTKLTLKDEERLEEIYQEIKKLNKKGRM